VPLGLGKFVDTLLQVSEIRDHLYGIVACSLGQVKSRRLYCACGGTDETPQTNQAEHYYRIIHDLINSVLRLLREAPEIKSFIFGLYLVISVGGNVVGARRRACTRGLAAPFQVPSYLIGTIPVLFTADKL